jgi:hypothetical protein
VAWPMTGRLAKSRQRSFALEVLPVLVQFPSQLADPAGRHTEPLGGFLGRFPQGQRLGDATGPPGQQPQPVGKVEPRRSRVRGAGVLVLDQDLLPLIPPLVVLLQGLQPKAAAMLGILRADVVGVQLAADPAAVPDLANGELDQGRGVACRTGFDRLYRLRRELRLFRCQTSRFMGLAMSASPVGSRDGKKSKKSRDNGWRLLLSDCSVW